MPEQSVMKFGDFLKKGISLKKQHAGRAEDGPLGPFLRDISKIRAANLPVSGSLPADGTLQPVGIDLVRIVSKLNLWVLFMNTNGSGIAPWRGLIVLDADFRDEGQVESPSRIGMVAHELTHLLQRELNQSHYWPSGGFNPIRWRRWIGDSTSYMEVLAYLVGWTVEYDLISARLLETTISGERRAEGETVLKVIRDRLASFTRTEPRTATRMIGALFPNNPIYQQNLLSESRYPDRRIPPGSWHDWLRQLGFSRAAVDHIMVLAARGNPTF